jgi:sortase B
MKNMENKTETLLRTIWGVNDELITEADTNMLEKAAVNSKKDGIIETANLQTMPIKRVRFMSVQFAGLAAAALVLAIGTVLMFRTLQPNEEFRPSVTDGTAAPVTVQSTPSQTTPLLAENPPEMLQEYREYWETNPDFVGYLSIFPYINYPVAQADDNEFYLNHEFNRTQSMNGAIFADYRNRFDGLNISDNTILYGHNLITKQKLQPLTNYIARDGSGFEFLKNNPLIRFDTKYEQGEYKIFSVFQISTEEHDEVFDYTKRNSFNSEEEFHNFVTEALDRSRYHTDVDLRYGDKFLTLSTCDYSLLDDIRVVIVARRVREGESANMNTDSFVNLRDGVYQLDGGYFLTGRNADGYMRYKMFEEFYTYFNMGKGWAGREWDISRVEGLKIWG